MAQCRADGCSNPARGIRKPWCLACENAKWPRRQRICEACNAEYTPSYTQQRSCGRECGRKIARPRTARPKALRTCSECKTEIGRPRVVCSDACAKHRLARRDRAARDIVNAGRPAPCCPCGAPIPERRNLCDECLDVATRSARRRAKVRRRARYREVEHEPYTLHDIARRDGYRCGICAGPVAMAERVPSLNAPTIDHVLPLAKGGSDTPANVQLAHFICNSRKGANFQEVA